MRAEPAPRTHSRTEPSQYTRMNHVLRRLRRAAARLEDGRPESTTELASALDELDFLFKQQDLQQEEQQLARPGRNEGLRYQDLFEAIHDGCLLTDTNGVILEANQAAAGLLRIRRDSLIGMPLATLVVPEGCKGFYRLLTQLRHDTLSNELWEFSLRFPGEERLRIGVTVAVLRGGFATGNGFLWVLRNVTRLWQAEASLRAERDFATTLVDTAQVSIFVLDAKGSILRVNPYSCTISGYDGGHLVDHDWCGLLLFPEERPAARGMLLEALTRGESKCGVYRLRTRHGLERSMSWSAQYLTGDYPSGHGILLVGHDVTELQEAQRKATEIERMAAIGEAATGLAHESRNALQRGQACLEMLRLAVVDRPDVLDLVNRAQKAQDDLLRLYEGVRSYAAPIRLAQTRCQLQDVWREAWAQVSSNLAEQATLQEEPATADLSCECDPFQLGQVFRNILENAADAVAGPLQVSIRCRETELDGKPALLVSVRDNGPGLNEEQRLRILEPFYTTKVRGTGLGMAIARRIVEAHGGRLSIGDPPGAEILIILPKAA